MTFSDNMLLLASAKDRMGMQNFLLMVESTELLYSDCDCKENLIQSANCHLMIHCNLKKKLLIISNIQKSVSKSFYLNNIAYKKRTAFERPAQYHTNSK